MRVPLQVEPVLREIGRLAHHAGQSAYLVGGSVRDWQRGSHHAEDLDITIEGDGIGLAHAAGRALGGTVTAHQQFGTATLVLPGRVKGRVDFASCRRETYARPGAYPRVEPGTLHDDLFRRDFTINAMAMTILPAQFGTLIDPFGGVKDLEQHLLRVMHDQSFLDDPSRILRGIRFRHRFSLEWEPKTREYLRQAIHDGALGLLNAGRLSKELDRMSQEPDPLGCVQEFSVLLGARR